MARLPVDSGPSGSIVKVTSGQSMSLCRALLVGVAGTATLINEDGSTASNVPLQAGYNPLSVSRVTFGSCDDVWALY
ncbi:MULTISPECIES: hypothetical protein [unclassified Bradyrhizobium]|uniref:hypothetical protein n=1 Tax=unclassified Bradyrhizobium TaxID=2631580 RepID=UPI002FEF3AF2